MIFKIQIPIPHSSMGTPALVYNIDRSIQFRLPVDDYIKSLFKPGVYKIYVNASVLLSPDNFEVNKIIGTHLGW